MQYVRQTGWSVICENCFLTHSRVAWGTFSLSLKGESVLGSWEVWLVTPAKWLFFRGRHDVIPETTGKKKDQMILRRISQLLLRQVTDPVSLLMEAVLSPRKEEKILAALSKRQKNSDVIAGFFFTFDNKRNSNLLQANSVEVEPGGFTYRVHTRWPGIWASWPWPIPSFCRLSKRTHILFTFTCFIHTATLCLPLLCGNKRLKMWSSLPRTKGKEINIHWGPTMVFLFYTFLVIFSTSL